MRVEIKKLVGTKWKPVELTELIGKSIAEYVAGEETKTTAALFEGDKPVAFMSNDDEIVTKLRAKGLSMHAKDLLNLFKTVEKVDLIAGVFKGSTFVERSLTDRMS